MKIPFVQAKNYTRGRLKAVRLIVLHDMESPEKGDTAESVARYFATTTRQASAHFCVDADSVVQCVKESDTAWAAPGVNADGIHIEHAGYASQSRGQWLDAYSTRMLNLSARLTARLCKAHGIPAVKLTPAQLKAGMRGIIGHHEATVAYPPNAGHTDPGPNFPWDAYLVAVRAELDALSGRTWRRSRLVAALAALGAGAVGLAAGATVLPDPTPVPTKTVTASPTTPRPPTVTPPTKVPPVSSSSAGPSAVPTQRVTVTATRTVQSTRTVRIVVTTTRTVRPTPWEFVLVRQGDNLYRIAAAAGTTVPRVRALNPFLNPAALRPGTLVRVK